MYFLTKILFSRIKVKDMHFVRAAVLKISFSLFCPPLISKIFYLFFMM